MSYPEDMPRQQRLFFLELRQHQKKTRKYAAAENFRQLMELFDEKYAPAVRSELEHVEWDFAGDFVRDVLERVRWTLNFARENKFANIHDQSRIRHNEREIQAYILFNVGISHAEAFPLTQHGWIMFISKLKTTQSTPDREDQIAPRLGVFIDAVKFVALLARIKVWTNPSEQNVAAEQEIRSIHVDQNASVKTSIRETGPRVWASFRPSNQIVSRLGESRGTPSFQDERMKRLFGLLFPFWVNFKEVRSMAIEKPPEEVECIQVEDLEQKTPTPHSIVSLTKFATDPENAYQKRTPMTHTLAPALAFELAVHFKVRANVMDLIERVPVDVSVSEAIEQMIMLVFSISDTPRSLPLTKVGQKLVLRVLEKAEA